MPLAIATARYRAPSQHLVSRSDADAADFDPGQKPENDDPSVLGASRVCCDELTGISEMADATRIGAFLFVDVSIQFYVAGDRDPAEIAV